MSATESVELVTLHAVRLAGVASEEAVLDRALVSEHEVTEALARAAADGWIEPFHFADTRGWMMTGPGSTHLAQLLAREVEAASAHHVLARTLADFETLNGPFVDRIAAWQLRSTSPDESGFAGAGSEAAETLLDGLSATATELRRAISALSTALARFGRYPAQLDNAITRARTEGLRWVTGVGVLSCHTVWAELHQDLLSSLGRDRGPAPPGKAG